MRERFKQRLGFIFILVAVSAVWGQETTKSKPTYVLIPPGDVILSVASQPDCPLRLENSRLLFNLAKNQIEYDYDLRNVGRKSIVHVVTEAWRLNGTGGTLSDHWSDKHQLLRPKQIFRSDEYRNSVFVPYTAQIRERFKIGEHTRMLILLVVREVWFKDGTTFDANEDVDRIKALFDKLGETAEFLN